MLRSARRPRVHDSLITGREAAGHLEAAQWWPFGPMVTVLKLRGVPRARARGGELNTRWPLRAIGYVQLGVYAKVNARQCMRC